MSIKRNIDVQYQEGRYKLRVHVWRMAAILRDSITLAVVIHTRPLALLLAMITQSSFSFLCGYGAPLMALWAAGAQLKTKFTGSSCTEAGLFQRISLQTDPL